MSIYLRATDEMKAAATVQALLAAAQLIQHIEPIGERMRAEAVFATKYQSMKGQHRGNVQTHRR